VTTRHGQYGVGVESYAGFSPKSPAVSQKGTGRFTRLTSVGIGGQRRLSYKGIGRFTRLTTVGIGGRRVLFLPKTAEIAVNGGTTGVRRYTQSELDRMDDFGRIQLGLKTKEQERIDKEKAILNIPDLSILQESIEYHEIEVVPLSQVSQLGLYEFRPQTLQEKISDEDDIGLLLAIIEAHGL